MLKHAPPPTHTYDPVSKVYRNADGDVVLDPAVQLSSESLTAAQLATAAAFGFSSEAAPDILRVGGGTSDEEVSSKAHTDIAAAFTVDRENGV